MNNKVGFSMGTVGDDLSNRFVKQMQEQEHESINCQNHIKSRSAFKAFRNYVSIKIYSYT